ncbi:MAG: polyprenyl synthetase family protein [Candidatus Dormibacteraceae bacterium]
MTPAGTAGIPALTELSPRISAALDAFLSGRERALCQTREELGPLVDELRAVLGSGGKRVRPWLCCWGHLAAGGSLGAPIVAAAAALELVHTFALIQDDVMDQSALRRGRPTTHTTLGVPVALLVSDLALIWADQLLIEGGFAPQHLAAGFTYFNTLRTEIALGQYLDIEAWPDEARALEVNRLKTASYTVLRPIQLGMALAGAGPPQLQAVPAYAEAAGVAFQLRDDVLGAFGDEETTGKPGGDDLLRGKPTWLWARALRLGGAPPEGVGPRREWIKRSGAAADCEALIRVLEARALGAVDGLTEDAALREQLVSITHAFVDREA